MPWCCVESACGGCYDDQRETRRSNNHPFLACLSSVLLHQHHALSNSSSSPQVDDSAIIRFYKDKPEWTEHRAFSIAVGPSKTGPCMEELYNSEEDLFLSTSLKTGPVEYWGVLDRQLIPRAQHDGQPDRSNGYAFKACSQMAGVCLRAMRVNGQFGSSYRWAPSLGLLVAVCMQLVAYLRYNPFIPLFTPNPPRITQTDNAACVDPEVLASLMGDYYPKITYYTCSPSGVLTPITEKLTAMLAPPTA